MFSSNFPMQNNVFSVFCKICDLNTEREIVFCNAYLLALDNTKR